MQYTDEQRIAARQELARRELAKRNQSFNEQSSEQDEIPYSPPPKRTGIKGILQDIKDIPSAVLDYGLNIPEKAAESWQQIFTKPGRAFKNIIAGAGETLEAPINLLGAIGPYLKEREITNKIPGFQVPETGLEKMMGINEKQPGDELLRQMFMFASAPKLVSKIPGYKQLKERSKELKQHGQLTSSLEQLERQYKELELEHGSASQDYNALKNFLESQPGFETSNPFALERKSAESREKIQSLRKQSENIPEYLRATEEPIAPEKTPLSLVEPVKLPEKRLVSDENIRESERLLRTHEQKSADLEKSFGEGYLKKGYTHDVPIAEGVVKKVNKNKKDIGALYDKIENNLKDKNVVIPRTDALIESEAAARKLLENSRSFFKNDEEFENAIKKIVESDKGTKSTAVDIVPAADVLKNYRTLRHLGHKLNKEAYSTKVAGNKELQADLLSKANDFESTAQKLEELLEKHNLGGSIKDLKSTNTRWREEVTPLYKNTTYRKFLNGLGPDNIMKALRGSGPGQEIIRNIIKDDPELLRNIVGQRYAHNPEKLHEFDELTQEYIKHMPEIHDFRKEHFASKQAEALEKIKLDNAKHEYQLQKEQADIEHRKGIESAREQTRLKKEEIYKEGTAKQKDYEAQSKHFKMQEEIKSLEEKANKFEENAKKLKEKSDRKDITLKEKIETEQQIKQTKERLSKIQKDIKLKRKALKTLGIIGLSGIAGAPIYKKTKSMIGGN